MKKQAINKTARVKLIRGIVGDDGSRYKKGETVTLRLNLAKIVVNAGRGEYVEEDKAK